MWTPCAERSSAPLTAMPSTSTTSPPGTRGKNRSHQEEHSEGARPDRERRPVRVAEVADHVRELLDRVAAPALDPEQLGQLLDRHEDREPEDEPLDDRPRQEVRDEPEPHDPATRKSKPQKITSSAACAA